jgi:GNAT-family acetyltransferase (TIGR03103 family)
MSHRSNLKHRLERTASPSVQSWKTADREADRVMDKNVALDCGWGRLLFGQTYASTRELADALMQEEEGRRDIAFYLRDPHVVLSHYPDRLFLDPSNTYRLWLEQYRVSTRKAHGFVVRRVREEADASEINRIFASHGMVTPPLEFILEKRNARDVTYYVAEDTATGDILGTVTAVDHTKVFGDPENGSSFWCLAVDAQCPYPGVGEGLVRYVIESFQTKGRSFVDLSVMHDNTQATALYEKLGFARVPVFAIKRKNPINEPLFTPADPLETLNPYAGLIAKEAMRRGISVEIEDKETGQFTLAWGGRKVSCWESLSEMTSAVAFVRCDDKALTRRLLARAGIRVPAQIAAGSHEDNLVFMKRHGRVVVKPRRGEQGAGISVDVRDEDHLREAVAAAAHVCEEVLIEELVEGDDLRLIVIDYEVVAAAVRRPAHITGTGTNTVAELIDKQSRRRAAATGGESRIPVDAETRRCVAAAGYCMDDVPDQGVHIDVRKTANLHTGGTIHDVTADLHPDLARAAREAARMLEIPVVGFDFMVPSVQGPDYHVIEANERPGLANHEPQPTAQAFVDLLFPQTATRNTKQA